MFLLAVLAFLAPLAGYCWALAAINRRARPTMVSGAWDCAGMLLAASGILLVVLPSLLHHAIKRMMNELPLEWDTEDSFTLLMREWWLFWGLYFALVIVGALVLMWWRRSHTIIYNVDPASFTRVLQYCVSELGLASSRTGSRLVIGPRGDHQAANVPDGIVAGLPRRTVDAVQSRPGPGGGAEVTLDAFPSLYNVSLHWTRSSPQTRAAIEGCLDRALEDAKTYDNPASHWFMGVAGLLFGLMTLTGMVLILTTYFPRR